MPARESGRGRETPHRYDRAVRRRTSGDYVIVPLLSATYPPLVVRAAGS